MREILDALRRFDERQQRMEERQQRIETLLEKLPDAVVAALKHRKLSRKDEAALAVVLAAIWRAVEYRTFSVKSLREHAEIDGQLREALSTDGKSRQLGRLLGRGAAAARWIGQHRVLEEGESSEGLLWSVRVLSKEQTTKPT